MGKVHSRNSYIFILHCKIRSMNELFSNRKLQMLIARGLRVKMFLRAISVYVGVNAGGLSRQPAVLIDGRKFIIS